MSKKDNKEKKEQVESAEAEKRNNANQSGQQEEQKCAQSDGKADDSEKQESEADKMKRELEEQKDRYLRLSAEFDNYRRRVSKEKLDLIETASESVIKSLLPIIDDFERAVKALEESTDSDAAKEGTNLIYKKLVDLLKSRGVSEIEAVGKELDTDIHEAVAQIPAPEEGLKGKIVDCVQKGYKLGEKVIRFAKVVVGV
ncbi:MAG: nucleotide exchange factor GrpE [Candidatus Egerieousia sp.]